MHNFFTDKMTTGRSNWSTGSVRNARLRLVGNVLLVFNLILLNIQGGDIRAAILPCQLTETRQAPGSSV